MRFEAVRSPPVISIITPSLNSGRFIEETLDSVRALRTSHEHIVVDGGSADNTLELLRGRADDSLSWTSDTDGGQTHAVNLGLQRARGELVAWLNADDAYVSDHVDQAVELLRAQPGVDAVFGYMDIVDVLGCSVKRYRCGRFNWTFYLYAGEYIPTPTLIFRRSLLGRAPQLNEAYADAADYEFYLRLLRGAQVERIKKPLVRFRHHSESKTATDVNTQRREALAVRLEYARGSRDRVIMRGVERVRRLRNSVIAPWPKLPRSG